LRSPPEADEVIIYTEGRFRRTRVKDSSTGGKGVDVVDDSVGQSTFLKGLDFDPPARHDGAFRTIQRPRRALRSPRFRNAGKGSLFLTRPSLAHHRPTPEEAGLARRGDVLGWIASGKLELRIDGKYALPPTPRRPIVIWKVAETRRESSCDS
jgi:NADPH2:quinone reductase